MPRPLESAAIPPATPAANLRWCAPTAMALGSFALVAAALVLVGWGAGLTVLTSITPGFNPMKPNTAVCFALIGVAIVRRARTMPRRDPLSTGFALASLLIAGATLLQFILGLDFGIDRLLLPAAAAESDGPTPGRMSPASALAHTCAAIAVLTLARAPAPRVHLSELMAATTGVMGLTALLGYIFGTEELYRFAPFAAVALHTSVVFIVVAAGITIASPHHTIIRTITSPYWGGWLSRRLLCYAVLGPVVINWLAVRAELMGAYEQDITLAITTVIGVLVASVVVLSAAAWISRADEQRQALLRQQSSMMRELDHRVKNNLASVLALTSLTINNAESLDEFRDSFVGRIRALARTHEALAASRWEGVRLLDVIRLTIGPYTGAGRRAGHKTGTSGADEPAPDRLVIDGPDVLLPAVISSSVCASLHELATNAAKYGAFKHRGGQVRLTWTVSPEGMLDLEWRETGVPTISEPHQTGFGTEMIKGAVVHEMQGSVQFEYAPPGLVCRVRAPIARGKAKTVKTEPANTDPSGAALSQVA